MAQCQYKYKEGDTPVKKGIAAVGSMCGSQRAKAETLNLCYGHYRNWLEENDPEKLKAMRDKGKETFKKNLDASIENNNEIKAEAAKPGNKYGIDLELLEEMGVSEQVDLEKEYAHYLSLNLADGEECYAEKMAFARWLSTSELKRNPHNLEDVAKILGKALVTLELWRRSPDIVKFKNRNVESMIDNSFQYVFYKTMQGVGRLDPRFFKIYLDMKDKVSDKKSNNNFPKLPDHLVKMAEERQNGARGDLRGPLKDINDNAIIEMVRDGKIEVEQ